MTRDERDLDALLRQSTERLDPAPDTWAHISRRASRRKWAKAALSVAAGVIVVAGAVPAVIAVRDNNGGSQQSLSIGPTVTPPHSTPTRPTPIHTSSPVQSATPVPTHSTPPPSSSSLAGFFPDSLSFVLSNDGYLWGTIGTSRFGVLAHTTDGGARWVRLPAPPKVGVATSAGGPGDGQVRFAYQNDGFIFGSKYFVTHNAGVSWQQVYTPGYIDDLETVHGQVWALVRTGNDTVRLYSAAYNDPTLRRVPGVPVMHGVAGSDSIAVNYSQASGTISADVIVGSSAFYTTTDGTAWNPEPDPCRDQVNGGNVQTALLSTLNPGDVVAACGYNISTGTEDKRLYTTTSSGNQWTALPNTVPTSGYLETMSAGSPSVIMIGTSRGGAQVTRNGGTSWTADNATGGVSLGFLGFIGDTQLVALASPADNEVGAFVTSNDSGKNWAVHPFPS